MAFIRKVSLRQYRTVDAKWQFCAVPKDAKGKPRPNLVIVNGDLPTLFKRDNVFVELRVNHQSRLKAPINPR